MAPLKKKNVESLENLSLKAVLSSITADIYLTHLLTQDLKDSILLSSLRAKSRDELLKATSHRLQILPGLLNDQVRENLIKEFFNQTNLDKWHGSRIDILKVLLNETVTTLNLGSQRLPQETLTIIGERCPNITKLHVVLYEPDSLTDMNLGMKLFSKLKSNSQELPSNKEQKSDEAGPARKKRKISAKKEVIVKSPSSPSYLGVMASYKHLTEITILQGATNELLTALGHNADNLQKLKICYSYSITDQGVKGLCLKYPENHTQRRGCHLHELRVRSFHLNPCCSTLTEFDTLGTCVTHFGIAFLLKYLPQLRSLGDCNSISEALEILVGRNSILPKNYALLPTIKRHSARYKLARMKEERVNSNKFLLLSSLCPDLKELTLGHSYREVDLGRALESLWQKNGLRSQMGQLRHLKKLSLLNVGSLSVKESIKAVGHQLTHLHVYCKGLDLQAVLESCVNLTSLTLEGSQVSAPYEALEAVRPNALRNLEVVRVRSYLPSSYIDLILSNSKKLTKIDFISLEDIGDDKIEQLVNNGHFNQLHSLQISKANNLTIKAASTLIKKCPKLADLQDLGGWNINYDSFCKLQNEIEKGNFDISLTYGVTMRENDSDDASDTSADYHIELLDAFRNIFPIVIL
ncbi:hypothetical protein Anas_03310 [Armadillidium nasatum]|uniref:Uncharacterized protein n=1 Tax=Armadillidium nasatum TaxID=96803 RepID=A0A5N5T7Y7_9CRUS|nr:hypothetical protein Anas_03310 [Armadillidium nasatum]